MSILDKLLGKQPAVHVYAYLKDGTSMRGSLVAFRAGRYEMAACSVAPEGSDQFRPVMGRVIIPADNLSWYTIRD